MMLLQFSLQEEELLAFQRSAAPECAASSKVCHSVLSADGDGDDANLPPRTEEAKRKKTSQIRTTQSHTSLKF